MAAMRRDFSTDPEKWRLFVVLSSSPLYLFARLSLTRRGSHGIVAGKKTEKGRKHGDKRVSAIGYLSVPLLRYANKLARLMFPA